MNRVESVIQSALIHWVKETYPEIIITATANEKNYKETRQIGCLGITDLLLFTRCGRVLWLELKKKTGKLQPSQIDFNAMFDTHFTAPNYTRAVAYGYEEARIIIIEWMLNATTC